MVYEGGQYTFDEREIRPHEAVEIDFRQLRDAQAADKLRRVIPLDVNQGQIAFSMRGGENRSMSFRSEQISLSEGTASTYSCANCPCQNRGKGIDGDDSWKNRLPEVRRCFFGQEFEPGRSS